MPGEGLTLLSHDGIARKVRKQAYGQQRDAHVLLDTLESLVDVAKVPTCHQLLQAHWQNAMHILPATPHADDPKLQRALQVLADTAATDFDERSLRAGLRHGYRRAHRLYGKARETGEHKHFHRLRRWVKHLAAQMELVVLCRSGSSRAQLKVLTELGSTLGKFHDIDVFREHLQQLEAEHGSMPGLAQEIETLREHARATEATLLEKALLMAEQCLTEKPKRFASAKGSC